MVLKKDAAESLWAVSRRMLCVDPAPLRDMFSYGVDPSILSLACGNPDPTLFPAAELAETARQAVLEYPVAALQYGKVGGYPPFIEAVRRRLAEKEGIVCAADNLLVTTGSQQGFELTAKVLVNEGDTVVVEEPAFIGTLNAFRSAGAKLIGVPLEKDGLDVAALNNVLTAHPETRLVYTISTANNPTGITMGMEKRRALYEVVKKHRVLLAEDNPYAELRFEGKTLPAVKSMDTEGLVLYFGSFSKILAPGLRLGYVCAEADFIEALSVAKQTADLQTAVLPQIMTTLFMERYDLDAHVEKLRTCYGRKCAAMLDAVDRYFPAGVSRTEPDGGLFLWCDLNDGSDTNRLVGRALEDRVAFVPGYAFMADLTRPQSTLRLNFSAFSEEKIIEGVRRLGKLLSEKRK